MRERYRRLPARLIQGKVAVPYLSSGNGQCNMLQAWANRLTSRRILLSGANDVCEYAVCAKAMAARDYSGFCPSTTIAAFAQQWSNPENRVEGGEHRHPWCRKESALVSSRIMFSPLISARQTILREFLVSRQVLRKGRLQPKPISLQIFCASFPAISSVPIRLCRRSDISRPVDQPFFYHVSAHNAANKETQSFWASWTTLSGCNISVSSCSTYGHRHATGHHTST